MLNLNFRTKVLVPVIIVMVLLVAITVFVVNRRITRQFQNEAQNTLKTANAVFLNSQKIHQHDLLLRFGNLPNQPLYRSLFLVGHDSPTLRQNFANFIIQSGVDIVFYENATGIIASENRSSMAPVAEFQKAAASVVKQALQGNETVDTVRAGNQLYDAVSIPVSVDNMVIGALTIGSEIGNADAEEFRQLTQSQIILLAGGHIIASTLTNSDSTANFASLFGDSISAHSDKNSTPVVRQILLGDEHYFYVAGKFDSLSGDTSLGYLLLSSYENSLGALRATQQVLLGVSLCAILCGAAVVWFLVTRITEPLRELRDGTEAVGRGDLSQRVPVRSKDECGELAGAFNRMTENLQQSRAQLEQTVTTLKNTQEQLIQSEKLSAVGEFVAGVAHELNNPLAAVMGFSEILREADVGAEYRKYLDSIFKAAQRCQKIVQSLLSFARRHQPERKPVSVNELVSTVLEIVAYSLRTSNIEVATRLAPKLPAVLADGHQIQQVLLNIINNARQAIEAHQHDGQIKITTEVCEPNVRITIQDNGPGIPEEIINRIFDPFFTTKEIGKGTGLGLSLCYGIIKEHGGNIKPSSRRGEGATFIIELPIAHDASNVTETSKSSESSRPNPHEGTGKTILVIDDEEQILQMIQQALASCGYRVHTMANGETAIRELQTSQYDAIFCDWKMPGLSGRQIYEELQITNSKLCQRVIFITGDVINEQMQKFLESEKRPHLTKPFALTELRKVIKDVLAQNK